MKSKQRDIGIDITKILATVLVVCSHFFNRSGYYDEWSPQTLQYIMMAFRNLFITCVPLFMLITGYLMCGRDISLKPGSYTKHLRKLVPVLMTYALAVLVYMLGEIILLNDELGLKDFILMTMGFFYSWYVEMYIGLFMLIPLLNKVWNSEDEKQSRRTILLVMLFLTCVPTIVNCMDLKTPGAILHPSLTQFQTKLLPNWWQTLYPVTYYFIGGYIKKYVDVKKLNSLKLLCITILAWLVSAACSVNYGRIGLSIGFTDFWGYQTTILAVLIFLLVNSVNYAASPAWLNEGVGFIAKLTFGAIIVSFCSDKHLYMKLNNEVYLHTEKFLHFPSVVLKSIIISFLLSLLIYFVQNALMKIFSVTYQTVKGLIKREKAQ